MSEIRIHIALDTINDAVSTFISETKGYKRFAFYGGMGAGKTTFITALCQQLKALDLVSSPTFSIVNEYETELDETIYHFDFYRIKEPEELYDIGFEEYVAEDNWLFIEWPEKAEELLPEDVVKVNIDVADSEDRTMRINLPN